MTEQIQAIMRTDFLTLDPDMPIRQAAGLLLSAGQECAPILAATGELVGILTQKDCFRPAMQASYYQQWRGTVGDQMSSPVRTIEAESDLMAATGMFLEESHRAFPVLRSGKLVGLLRRDDLLRRLLELS